MTAQTEKDIFNLLDLQYRAPEERSCSEYTDEIDEARARLEKGGGAQATGEALEDV